MIKDSALTQHHPSCFTNNDSPYLTPSFLSEHSSSTTGSHKDEEKLKLQHDESQRTCCSESHQHYFVLILNWLVFAAQLP